MVFTIGSHIGWGSFIIPVEAFLSDFEGLLLGRSLGSAPWLFPVETSETINASSIASSSPAPLNNKRETIPQTSQKASMPTSFLRQESSLNVTIPPQRLPLGSFLNDRDVYPTKVRLSIRLGKSLQMRTNYFTITQKEPFIDFDNETWIIPCPVDIEKTVHEYPSIQICLEKPGACGSFCFYLLCQLLEVSAFPFSESS